MEFMSADTFYNYSHAYQLQFAAAENALARLKECGGSHLYLMETQEALIALTQAVANLQEIHTNRCN